MSYEIILSSAAEQSLAHLPSPVQNFIENELNRLGADPFSATETSRSILNISTVFRVEENTYDQKTHVFYIPFRFSQDET